mgnify:CR=1 FL=1
MKGKSIFYRWLGRIFWLSAVAVTGYTWYYMDQAVPDRVSIIENEEEEFSFGLPLKATISSDSQEVALSNESNIPADQITISGRDHFSMFGGEKGSYQVGLKLFGVIKLKDIQVDVVDTRYAIPCGSPIGIYLKSDGVMVIGTGRITGSDGMEVEPAYGILKSGDYIEAFNGKPMNTKEDLIRAVSESGGQDCVLQVRREGEDVDISLKPVQGRYPGYRHHYLCGYERQVRRAGPWNQRQRYRRFSGILRGSPVFHGNHGNRKRIHGKTRTAVRRNLLRPPVPYGRYRKEHK